MARTKTTARAPKKSATMVKVLEAQTKSELLKTGRAFGLFEDVNAKTLSGILKSDMIRQIIDASAMQSGEEEIIIGEEPKPKKVAKKPAAKKTVAKKVSPKKAAGSSDYSTMPVSSLLALCKQRGIEACAGKKSMLKRNIIPALEEWDLMSSKKPATTKKVAKKPAAKRTSPKARVSKCTKDQVMILETGACIKKTKTGAPYGEAALKRKYGQDYVYDEKLGIVGREADVDSYRSEFIQIKKIPAKKAVTKKTKTPPKKTVARKAVAKKTKTPPKKVVAKKTAAKRVATKKQRCDDQEDPLMCDDGKVCSTKSGSCIADTAAARKGNVELRIDNRVIIGDKETIERLQNVLGGTIVGSPKAKVTKKVAAKKTVRKVAAKAKNCYDKEDPLQCGENEVCNASKGCVADNATSRKGAYELSVDGRVIIGTKASIEKLRDLLGGDIKAPGAKAKVAMKVKSTSSDAEDIESRLQNLLEEDDIDVDQINDLRSKLKVAKKVPPKPKTPSPKKKLPPVPPKKLPPKPKTPSPKKKLPPVPPKKLPPKPKSPTPKKPKTPSPKKPKTPTPKKPTSFKVELEKQKIYDTFQKCLASLQA